MASIGSNDLAQRGKKQDSRGSEAEDVAEGPTSPS